MGKIDQLADNYQEFCSLPWDRVAAQQRTWFAIYPPDQERKLRFRIADFEYKTVELGRKWALLDLTALPAQCIASLEYRDTYFRKPRKLTAKLTSFESFVIQQIRASLDQSDVDENTVVAFFGIGSMFGFMRVSILVDKIVEYIPGRLLMFFPGEIEGNTYRLFGLRDGWNYHAVPITA